jgi:hypothetical protein
MALNITTRKSLSEANIKQLINILIGICGTNSDDIETLKEQCIVDFNENTIYKKNDIVIYSNKLYRARTSYSGAWDESKFILMNDTFTELSIDDIKGFLELTTEELETISKIIDDNVIQLDKSWSSSKIYMDIAKCLADAKLYADEQIGKNITPNLKKATSTSEVIEEGIIYLILNADTDKYDMYALIDGNIEPLGTVDVSFDNYYTKPEIEADYLKKTDAQGTYASITSLDNKVDKDNISQNLSNPSEDTVLSTQGLQDIIGNPIKTYTTLAQLGLTAGCSVSDIFNAMEAPSIASIIVDASNVADLPQSSSALYGILEIKKQATGRHSINFKQSLGESLAPNNLFIGQIKGDGTELIWNKVGFSGHESLNGNLFPNVYYNNTTDTRNGITSVKNEDGSVTLSGTSTGSYFFVFYHRDYNGLGKAVNLRGKTLTLSGGTASPVLSLAFYDEDNNNVTPPDNEMLYDRGNGLTVTVPDNAYSIYSYLYMSAGNTINQTFYPMLELGDVAHEYQPSKKVFSPENGWETLMTNNSNTDPFSCTGFTILTGTEDLFTLNVGHYTATKADTAYNYPITEATNYVAHIFVLGKLNDVANNKGYRTILYFDNRRNFYKIGEWWGGFGSGWEKVCTAKTDDVAKTNITFTSVDNYNQTTPSGNKNCYVVKNGICYVNVNFLIVSPTTSNNQVATLPTPATGEVYDYAHCVDDATINDEVFVQVNSTGALTFKFGTINKQYVASFSYPVAE